MATLGLIDIMATRKTDWINNFWKALAHHPATLRRTWASVKEIMAPGALDAVTKEMIYLAVSATNQCGYCIASHTAAARKACPAAATACVDLSDHLTWLQSDGRITYGPVPMEPGPPGTQRATPRGTFHVQWKAGPNYISTEYDEPMPYAVFFAPGGIAFHGGSLTIPSHGCVHLDIGSARYYHDHLPVGAEVVAFLGLARGALPAPPALG